MATMVSSALVHATVDRLGPFRRFLTITCSRMKVVPSMDELALLLQCSDEPMMTETLQAFFHDSPLAAIHALVTEEGVAPVLLLVVCLCLYSLRSRGMLLDGLMSIDDGLLQKLMVFFTNLVCDAPGMPWMISCKELYAATRADFCGVKVMV